MTCREVSLGGHCGLLRRLEHMREQQKLMITLLMNKVHLETLSELGVCTIRILT